MMEVTINGMRVDGNAGSQLGFDTLTPNNSGGIAGYVGGHPVGISTGGFMIGSGVTDARYVGVLYNNSLIDTNVGANQVGTASDLTQALPAVVWRGGSKVKFFKGTRQNVADSIPPFKTTVTWAAGNPLYLSTTGNWTNVSASGRIVKQGKVLIAPADADATMEALLY